MADITVRDAPAQDIPIKYHDNGDGTYSKQFYTGAGGGGGAVTIADGADVAEGTTTDAASASTVIGLLKNLKAALAGTVATSVADGSNVTIGALADASSANSLVGLLKNIKAALAGTLANNIAQINGVTPLMGAGNTGTGSQRVTIATDQAVVPVSISSNPSTAATTATLSNVAGSASSVTLLALNTNRLGAVIVNDSTATLYIKYAATASSTSFTYELPGTQNGIPSTLELPASPRWTGIITGIWVSAVGSARCTELTA